MRVFGSIFFVVIALIPDFYWFYTINAFSSTTVSAEIGTEEIRISRAFSGPEAFRETKKNHNVLCLQSSLQV